MYKSSLLKNKIFLILLILFFFVSLGYSKRHRKNKNNPPQRISNLENTDTNRNTQNTGNTEIINILPSPDMGLNNGFYEDENNKHFYRRYINCSNTNCPYPNQCISKSICKCSEGFSDLGRNENVYCQHNQRKSLTALLLEFFFPFGVGHFYCGRYLIGIIKLIWYLIPMIMIIYMVRKKLKFISGANNDNMCFLFTTIFLCCGLTIWTLVDLIKFGTNKYKDGWGVPLKPII